LRGIAFINSFAGFVHSCPTSFNSFTHGTSPDHNVAEIIRNNGAALLKECENKVPKANIEVDAELIETMGTSVGECIVKKAKEVDADLIICGTHGRRGIRRLLMGSDAEHIVRRAPVPVLLVHQESAAHEA
jgi:nucleotide-binding universal stress UspA family protein